MKQKEAILTGFAFLAGVLGGLYLYRAGFHRGRCAQAAIMRGDVPKGLGLGRRVELWREMFPSRSPEEIREAFERKHSAPV